MENFFTHEHKYGTLIKFAGFISVTAAICMVAIKGFVWLNSGSASVLSALVDSITDVIASLITFFAVKYAVQPADTEHKFGYGKLEAIAGLMQAGFIVFSAVFLLQEIGSRYLNDKYTTQIDWKNIFIMSSSLILTFIVIIVQKFVIKRTNSLAIKADSMHYFNDFLLNSSVVIGMSATIYFNNPMIDLLLGLGIALYVLKGGYDIGKIAVSELIDAQISKDERIEIKNIILSHKDVLGMHDLRTRKAGQKTFIQCDIEVDENMSLNKAHDIAVAVETLVIDRFPDFEVMIHIDPYGHPHEYRNHLMQRHHEAGK